MKKSLKNVLLIFLLVIFIFPSSINAQTTNITYQPVDRDINFTVDNLDFKSMHFLDYSNNSTQSFGLIGTVINNKNKDYSLKAEITYYDKNYKFIASASINRNIQAEENIMINLLSNLNIIPTPYKVSDIAFYSITLEAKDFVTVDITKPSQNRNYKSYEYVIDSYDVNVIVNQNNTFDITETITTYFNVSKHGIYRTIPLRNSVTRLDGTSSKNRVQISNLSVDNEYTTSRENGNYIIKIGSSSRTMTGEQTYSIKYTYNIGEDPIDDYDELYYNIIGAHWDTAIGNVTFTITMPKEFDSKKLGFSSGALGSTSNSNIKYTVNGNKIIGSYNGILEAHEALTIRCELPEGYFVGAGFTRNNALYILFLLPILFLLIALFLWYKYGRDEKVVETVEFYPPEGFNSLEVGFLYKGVAENQDVTSLLIYLANKGYIKIAEIEGSNDFKITKLKEYDGDNSNEQTFLDGLFEASTKNSNEVTSMDLYDHFYTTMRTVLTNINTQENKNKIFEKGSTTKGRLIMFMITMTFPFIAIPPIMSYYWEPSNFISSLLFPGIGITALFYMLFGGTQSNDVNDKKTNSRLFIKIFIFICFGIFGGIPWAFMVLELLQDPIYLIGYIVGICCVFGMMLCIKYLPKRTPYGNEMLGKLQGFRNFLETAEKDKLEAMVVENPNYFYDILPFTYVLGISDKWIKKFEVISLQTPSWVDSSIGFDVTTFGTFMNTTMSSAQSVMSSSPSNDSSGSSGGSSGGGSSDGGSGGGGGGSW